ncbi:MAG: hypothetical protein ACLFUF_01185, partial [Opitutales bacterium]
DEEETEEDALDRKPWNEGGNCSTRYEQRTDAYDFSYRTAKYTVKAENLQPGVTYEGCVRLRKREAYSGTLPDDADTDWYDVEPDLITSFQRTSSNTDEDGITTVEEDVDIPFAKGYEYELVSVHIWPTYAGCDCPTLWEDDE